MSRPFTVGDRVRVRATDETGEVDAALMDSVNVRIDDDPEVRYFTADELVHDPLGELARSIRAGREEPT